MYRLPAISTDLQLTGQLDHVLDKLDGLLVLLHLVPAQCHYWVEIGHDVKPMIHLLQELCCCPVRGALLFILLHVLQASTCCLAEDIQHRTHLHHFEGLG